MSSRKFTLISDDTVSERNSVNEDINYFDYTISSNGIFKSNSDISLNTWKPNTFTVAELVRCSRQKKCPFFAIEVILWGLENEVYIPPGVISDSISLIYRFLI